MSEIPQLTEAHLKSLEALDEIVQKNKDLASVSNIKNDYLQDEKKKMIWENGFGEKLEKNPSKVNDKEWIEDQLDVATERISLKLEMAQLKEKARVEEDVPVPAIPGTATPTPEANNSDFNNSTVDIFQNKEFLDKMDKGHRLMLEINKPSKVPNYRQ